MTALTLKILSLALKSQVFTIRHGPAKGLKRRYGPGFKPNWSISKEEQYLMKLNLEGKAVYDIGAYIGIYTLFFARAVGQEGHVVALEPNPHNYQELLSNIQLNQLHNTTTIPVAVGNSCQNTALSINPIYPARGFIKSSRTQSEGETPTVQVNMVSLDNLIQARQLPTPDFIKLDVEGVEIDAIHGMEKTIHNHKPDLFIEFHCEMTPLIQMLHTQKYTTYHIETATMITCKNIPDVTWGHLFCT